MTAKETSELNQGHDLIQLKIGPKHTNHLKNETNNPLSTKREITQMLSSNTGQSVKINKMADFTSKLTINLITQDNKYLIGCLYFSNEI